MIRVFMNACIIAIGMSTRRVPAARPSARKRPTVRRKAAPRAGARKAPRVAPKARSKASNAIGSALGSALGGMLGGPAGMGIGSALGSGAQGLFRAITGVGDYKVTSNSLMGGPGIPADSLPKFSNSGRGVRLTHREYIQDIVTHPSVAGGFNLTKVAIQPALTLPWASTVAQNFQEYKIHGMIFEFKSTSSDALNSTNTALGTVVMATQYNVLQPDYTNKQQMDQSEFSCSSKPSTSIIHPIECARGESMMSVLSTRNAPAPTSSSDLRLYDFANFYIATAGGQATGITVGELWVSYDIELLKPSLGSAADQADVYVLGAGITTSAYFGSSIPAKSASSDLGTTLANTTITFPASFTGQVQMTYIVGGTGATVQAPTVTPSAGASNLNMFAGYQNPSIGPGGTYSAGNMISSYTFSCVGGGLLTFSGGQLPTATTQGTLILNVLPSTLRASLT